MAGTVYETVTVASLHVTVDLVVWRRFHRPMPGLVERIYDLNFGLADLGPVLPVGTVFKLPVDAPPPVQVIAPPRVLWPAGS